MFTKTEQMVQIHHVTVMHAIQSFLRIAMQGKSPQTKHWYSYGLDVLARHLGETRPLIDILEVDLISYREMLEARKISPDTLHGYLRIMRRLFKWLYKRGFISSDISSDVPLPKPSKRGKKGISDENAARILEAAKQHSIRDYAMILFFASSNARRGGVQGLRLEDINLDAPEPLCRQAQVLEKGEKERTIIMDDETLHAMREWLKVRPPGSNFVFVTRKGKPLAVSSVSEIIDRYKMRLGIKGRCSPHQWRHRWFRRMLSNRMPLTQAAQLGGHADTKVTYQHYGQFAFDELQEAYDRFYQP